MLFSARSFRTLGREAHTHREWVKRRASMARGEVAMRRTTSLAAAVAVAVCSLAFAACGGDDSSSGSSSGKVEGEISLLAPEYSDNTEGWWRDVISGFEKANPGAKVKLQMVSWTDINQKITTLVSTNQAPDILNLDAYANFAADDLLLPADDVLSSQTQSDFLDKFAENGKYDGTQYGIPFVGSVRGLFSNKDKVTQPNPGTTNRTDLWKVFGAGKIGMVMGSNFYPVLLKAQNPKLNYGVAPVPVNGSNPPVTLGVEDYLMAFKSTKHQPVVKAFLDYVFQKQNYGKFIAQEGFLPVTKSVSETVASKDPQQKLFIDAVDDARFYPTTNPTWAAIAPQVKQNLGSAVQGKDPAEVLNGLQKD